MADEQVAKIPNLRLKELKFLLTTSDEVISPQDKEKYKQELLQEIDKHNMGPFYEAVCSELKWSVDQSLVQKYSTENEKEIKRLEDKIQDAVENLGESEIREANLAKSNYYTIIGAKQKAATQYRTTLEKTVGQGQKMNIVLTLIRLGIFWNDVDLITRNIQIAQDYVDKGADWDSRNRLKAHQALYLCSVRSFEKAAELLLDTLATFTATELFDYKQFVYYVIFASVVALDRVKLKERVINAPEILQIVESADVAPETKSLSVLLNSLYDCNYRPFFKALAETVDYAKQNPYLATHVGWFCKEMRIKAYTQVLESYKSLKMETMAQEFGVSVEFLDNELSRFISVGRIFCKIDKVSGIVETNRPDSKNAQYASAIKKGDILLNRIQKLSRVINL